jgi:hypothetical protein
MYGKDRTFRIPGLILLSSAIYQIIAAGIAIFIWIPIGDWRNLIPQIIIIAFGINLPVTYYIWHRFY